MFHEGTTKRDALTKTYIQNYGYSDKFNQSRERISCILFSIYQRSDDGHQKRSMHRSPQQLKKCIIKIIKLNKINSHILKTSNTEEHHCGEAPRAPRTS